MVLPNPTAKITQAIGMDETLAGNGGCYKYNGPFTFFGTTTPKG